MKRPTKRRLRPIRSILKRRLNEEGVRREEIRVATAMGMDFITCKKRSISEAVAFVMKWVRLAREDTA